MILPYNDVYSRDDVGTNYLVSNAYDKSEVDALIKESEDKIIRVIKASKWKSRVKKSTSNKRWR